MPDRNGWRTLRDHYPLTCARCGAEIKAACYANGELVSEAEPYRVIGMTATHPDGRDKGAVPQCTYAHVACLGAGQK